MLLFDAGLKTCTLVTVVSFLLYFITTLFLYKGIISESFLSLLHNLSYCSSTSELIRMNDKQEDGTFFLSPFSSSNVKER